MQRILRRLLPLVALVSVVTVGAPTPAHADTDTCTGVYTMTLSTGFGLPVLTNNTASFLISMTAGACAAKPTLTMAGTVTGACGLASGSGTTYNGHSFTFQWFDGLMVFTGQVTGVLAVNEDPTDVGSCTTKTAVNFTLMGSLAKTH